jgi:capsular polysaccharide biosynthesis protein
MPSPSQVLRRLLAQGVLLVVAVLLGAAAGAIYAAQQTPRYDAAAYVVLSPVSASGDDTTAVNLAQAYGRIVRQDVVLARAAGTLGHGGSMDELRRHVRVSTSPDVPLIQLTASADAPARAADLANAVAKALVEYGIERRAQTRVRIDSFAEASPPSGPSAPNRMWDIAVGAAAGLLLGALAVTAGVGQGLSAAGRRRREDVNAAGVGAGATAGAGPIWRPYGSDGGPERFVVPRPRAGDPDAANTWREPSAASAVDGEAPSGRDGTRSAWAR